MYVKVASYYDSLTIVVGDDHDVSKSDSRSVMTLIVELEERSTTHFVDSSSVDTPVLLKHFRFRMRSVLTRNVIYCKTFKSDEFS